MMRVLDNSLIALVNNIVVAMAFIKKDMKIAVSYRMQFVFQFLQVFFGIAIIYFIGRMVEGGGNSNILNKYGGNYFSFALVGIAVNSYLRAGLVSITNDMRQIMNQGTLEAMCATPVGHSWLIVCCSLWQFIFETFRVLCYFGLGILAFGVRFNNANWWSGILSLMLTWPVFLMLGCISCSILIVVKKGDPVNWVFSSVGAILAGTMFPVDVLPGWMRKMSMFMPLTYSLEAVRKSLLMGANIFEIKGELLALAGFCVLLLPLSILINSWCMKIAKRAGAFSTH